MNYEVQGFLKICQLPSAYNYDNYWPVQKVKLVFMYTYYTLTLFKGFYLVYRGFIHCAFVGPLAWHPTSGHILCRAVPLSTYCLCSCKYYVLVCSWMQYVLSHGVGSCQCCSVLFVCSCTQYALCSKLYVYIHSKKCVSRKA